MKSSFDLLEVFDVASTYDVAEMRTKATKLILESKIPNKIILNKIPNMNKRDLMKLLTRFTNERGVL